MTFTILPDIHIFYTMKFEAAQNSVNAMNCWTVVKKFVHANIDKSKYTKLISKILLEFCWLQKHF